MPIVRSKNQRPLPGGTGPPGASRLANAEDTSSLPSLQPQPKTMNSIKEEKQKKHLLEKLASVLRIPQSTASAYPPFQRIPHYSEGEDEDPEDDGGASCSRPQFPQVRRDGTASAAATTSGDISPCVSGDGAASLSEEEIDDEDDENCNQMYLAAELKRREETLAGYAAIIKRTKEVPLQKLVFFGEGCEVFDELCLLIDINQRYASLLPQWKDVADALEIDSIRTKWVETCVRPREGLTRAILEIYMKDGGTLGEVLEALFKLQCYEILEKVSLKVNRFLDALESFKKNQLSGKPMTGSQSMLGTSDKFFSVIQTLAIALGSGDPCQELHKFLNRGLKSESPLINLDCGKVLPPGQLKSPEDFSQQDVTKSPHPEKLKMVFRSELHLNQIKEHETFQKEQTFRRVGADGKLRCKILLLFSGDGAEAANLTAVIARSVDNERVIADVFRLNETSLWYEMLTNPEGSCMKWIQEADYIVPVLTPKFLQEIHCNSTSAADEDQGLLPTSPVINRYMYTLARTQYTQSGCKNFKVRPVIPLSCLRTIRMSDSVKVDPLFNSSWVPLHEDRLERRIDGMLKEFLRRRQVALEAAAQAALSSPQRPSSVSPTSRS